MSDSDSEFTIHSDSEISEDESEHSSDEDFIDDTAPPKVVKFKIKKLEKLIQINIL